MAIRNCLSLQRTAKEATYGEKGELSELAAEATYGEREELSELAADDRRRACGDGLRCSRFLRVDESPRARCRQSTTSMSEAVLASIMNEGGARGAAAAAELRRRASL